MIVKRKLFSFIDEDGNLGYYLYNGIQVRIFAKKDYEGLSEAGKEALRKRRSDYAKDLYRGYRSAMRDIDGVTDAKTNILGSWGGISGGNVNTIYEAETHRGRLDSIEDFKNLHKKSIRKSMLDGSKSAADTMRKESLEQFGPEIKNGVVRAEHLAKAEKVAQKKSNSLLNPMKWSRNTKIGAGIGTGLVLAGTGAYLYNKSKKKDQ